MPRWTSSILCATLIIALCNAQVVQWDLVRRQTTHRVSKRSENSTFEEVIANNKGEGGYFATVTIGSPGQDLVMQLDTASSDSWVPYSGAPICEVISAGCELGSFDPHGSDSFKEIAKDRFEISYIDSSFAHGNYFKDSLEIGGVTVQNLTMGLGMQTDIPYGLVGVGYSTNEAALSTMGQPYPNLPIAMEQEGLINSIAYSLWLNDLDANTGNILFGGIDTAKFTGPLIKIDVIPDGDRDDYTHFVVPLTSIEATSPTGTDFLTSSEGPTNVVLDSGTTLTYLPNDITSKVWEEVGAEYQSTFGMAVLPCSHASHPGYFSFGFAGPSGPLINITMDELVVDLTNGDPPQFNSGPYAGELVCEFGIQNYSTGPFVLGNTFLRSAYIVYDLENHEIGIAATKFNSTDSDIVAFESKGAKIPLAATPTTDADISNIPLATSTDLSAADGFQDVQDDDDDDESCSSRTVLNLSSIHWYALAILLLAYPLMPL